MADAGAEGQVAIRLVDQAATERRRHVRAPADLELAVFAAGSTEAAPGACVDVSEGGIQAILPLELEAGDSVRLVLGVPGGSSTETTARVVRQVAEHRYGLAFELTVRGRRDRVVAAALERAARASFRPAA